MNDIFGGSPTPEEKQILKYLKERYDKGDFDTFLKKDGTKFKDEYYINEKSTKELLLFLNKKDLNKVSYRNKSEFIKISGSDSYLVLSDRKWCLYMIKLEQKRSVDKKKKLQINP